VWPQDLLQMIDLTSPSFCPAPGVDGFSAPPLGSFKGDGSAPGTMHGLSNTTGN
jgi:hypothetical protein